MFKKGQPIDEAVAVQVVVLVLDDDGLETVEPFVVDLALEVQPLQLDLIVSPDRAVVVVGERQAPLARGR